MKLTKGFGGSITEELFSDDTDLDRFLARREGLPAETGCRCGALFRKGSSNVDFNAAGSLPYGIFHFTDILYFDMIYGKQKNQ